MKYLSRKLPLLIAVLICAGQGCSTTQVSTDASVPVEDQSTPSGSSRDVRPDIATSTDFPSGGNRSHTSERGSTAVVALLEKARMDMDSGRMGSAAATLERALRMDSKNALLWHRLALVRRQQNQWQQSLSLARKSNSLAAGDRDLQLANWRIIASSSEQLGDDVGAEQAREMIEKFDK